MRAVVLAAVVLVLGACTETAPDRSTDIDYLVPAILEPNCATSGCHSKLAATADLILEGNARAVRRTLVDRGFVLPGLPEGSALLNFLRGDFGVPRMPPDAPLPAEDVDLLERWIVEGAP